MNILIYGFGRMGLTHFTILNGYDTSSHAFTVMVLDSGEYVSKYNGPLLITA